MSEACSYCIVHIQSHLSSFNNDNNNVNALWMYGALLYKISDMCTSVVFIFEICI